MFVTCRIRCYTFTIKKTVFRYFHSNELSMREKCPNTEFFLVRIFLHSHWIQRFTPYSVRYRKIRIRKNSVSGHFSRSVLDPWMGGSYEFMLVRPSVCTSATNYSQNLPISFFWSSLQGQKSRNIKKWIKKVTEKQKQWNIKKWVLPKNYFLS